MKAAVPCLLLLVVSLALSTAQVSLLLGQRFSSLDLKHSRASQKPPLPLSRAGLPRHICMHTRCQ